MRKKIVDFSKYSSIKLGSSMEVFVIENDYDALNYDGTIIGGACNLIVSSADKNLAVLGEEFDYVWLEDDRLYVGAAISGGRVFRFAKKNNLAGFEFLGGLPGTIGGMLSMNAGLKTQEIFNRLIAIRFADGYKQKSEIQHGYRYAKLGGIALEAVFEAQKGYDEALHEELKNARKNQPKNPSAGSCFKNPPNNYAGKLIEDAGLKGFRIGDMAFSDVHANFLVNLGNGKAEEAFEIIEIAKKRVLEYCGIELELEIKII